MGHGASRVKENIIDLSLSDNQGGQAPTTRQRRKSLRRLAIGAHNIELDPDVAIVEPQEADKLQDVNLDDNEDLVVVQEAGQVWSIDLPHPRELCGRYPFRCKAVPGNKEHCPKCFCFVCDAPAAECQAWGSGRRLKDHCNAHSGSKQHIASRSYRQKRRRAESGLEKDGDSVPQHGNHSAAAAAVGGGMREGVAAAAEAVSGSRAAAGTVEGAGRGRPASPEVIDLC